MEQLVAAHYAALGYNVISDINRKGSQVDLLCTKHVNGIGLLTVAVEVKHRSAGSIGVGMVRDFNLDDGRRRAAYRATGSSYLPLTL